MHLILVVLIFFAVIIAAVVIVGGWIVVSLSRGVGRFLFGKPKTAAARQTVQALHGAVCSRIACNADNPAHAQFCRRCGEPLPVRSTVTARRVA